MKKTTALTRQDLKIYKSQRLTDTPDGGGMMTNQPLVGADNELFDPISDVDRTMGALDTRLIYPAVLRDDDEKLLGANVIVSQPPEAENASILIVPADHYGQERASIMERIEAYRVPTVETRMTLWGTQLKGSRLVRVYQMISAPIPVVGDVLALRVIVDEKPVYDFVRIERLTHSIDTFEESNGVEFQRRVIQIVAQQPLERDFVGVERVSKYDVFPPARVMDTQIADSAKYYGIKPLAEAIVQGAASLKLPTVFEQLVPVSTVETPMADDWASGRLMWIETAPRRNVYSGSRLFQSGERLYLECPVLPASVQIDGWTDDGLGHLVRGDKRLQIDYANGVISGFDGVNIGTVSAIPAVQVRNFAYSAAIEINETNIGTDFAPLLRPRPARGSVAVDFISSSTWYQLNDNGDGILRDNQNRGRGQVSRNGSAVISLPVQPDANSHLLVSWTPQDFYHNYDGSEAGEAILPSNLSSVFRLPETPKSSLKPNSIRLTWNNGMAQTASDQNGKLSGDATGWVDYAAGLVYPDAGLRAAAVQIRAEQYIGAIVRKNVSVKDGDVMTFSAGARIQAGTLAINMPIGHLAKPNAQPVYPTPSLPTPRRLSTSV
ncbi:hypothetical protein MIS33_07785 [Wielerella bovis]|uniref:hypothetical protein n=1 Tax=Wielerella bovis TaxID=2917790 RepID=UPI0020195DB9|nr:hypothetical protein [Wielerella bovis]ULJ64061.1 hypothetical protein MIS33_07785 [Wielerella bovis]